MIEVEEVKSELEQPNDTDIRLLFADLQKPMEALQKIFVGELEKLKADNVNTERAGIEIKDGVLIIRLGDFVLYHNVFVNIYDLRENNG